MLSRSWTKAAGRGIQCEDLRCKSPSYAEKVGSQFNSLSQTLVCICSQTSADVGSPLKTQRFSHYADRRRAWEFS